MTAIRLWVADSWQFRAEQFLRESDHRLRAVPGEHLRTTERWREVVGAMRDAGMIPTEVRQ